MQPLPIARVILYVKNIPKVAAFYQRFFGLESFSGATDSWVELGGPSGSCSIALHQAAKSQKSGAAMKLVFAVKDVEAFVRECERKDCVLARFITQTDSNSPTPKILRGIPSASPAVECESNHH